MAVNSPYQPYRQGAMRPQTSALHAMLLGKPLYLPNPIDQQRRLQKQGLLALLTRR
jgi:hypothetical protein